jgi:hypothetical protein
MPLANILAMALGFIVAGIGALGIAFPSVLLELGRSMQSSGALYVVAACRAGFGVILLWASPGSRTPRTFRILGILMIVAGVATWFFGADQSRAVFDWWVAQGSFVQRAWSVAAVGFGLFVAYAASSRR